MQTLKVVADTEDLPDNNARSGAEADCAADKIACMLNYLRSLERDAEALHGDDDDWRYGRYLVYSALTEAVKSAHRQSG